METTALPPFLSHHFSPKREVWEAFAVRTDEFCVVFLVKARLNKYDFTWPGKWGGWKYFLVPAGSPHFLWEYLVPADYCAACYEKKKNQHLPYVNSQPVGKVLQPQGSCSHPDIQKWVHGPPYKNILLSEMEQPLLLGKLEQQVQLFFPRDTSFHICLSAIVYFWCMLTCRSPMDRWGQFPFACGRSIIVLNVV